MSTRSDDLAADARDREAPDDHPDRLLAQAAEAPLGEQVFHNFIDSFVGRS